MAMTTLSDRHVDVMMSDAWFARLAAPVRAAVLERMQLRGYAAGERVFTRGGEALAVYAVLEGAVRVSGTSRDGREAVLRIFEPGSWLGEVSVLEGSPRVHDASAYTRTQLAVLMRDDLEALMTAHSALMRELLRLECSRLRVVLTALEAYATQPLEQRFASRLIAMADAYGAPTPRGLSIELHLSQELLAQLVGVTRQRVNQLLKQWEQDGLVEQNYGRLLIVDRRRLEHMAAD